MNLIELKIGRDAESGKLCVTIGGKTVLAGEPDSVPKSVSREHVCLTVSSEGLMILQNLNIENDLYVNSYGVERKRIQQGDRIELGSDHYQLGWDLLEKFFRLADIRPLEQVWKDFQTEKLQLQIKERRFGVLRSATGLLTTAAMILGFMEGSGNGVSLRLVLYIIMGVVSLLFLFIAWRSASRVPLRQQQLEEETRRRYSCPACGSLFTMQSYDLLRQMKKCPHCGALIIK
ncbi:MAG: FHA domain-containing protein [Bacteroidaceae bacterium]|nr:FHA domain-containing protein [Bacteroidaceae bacterium]